MFEIFVVAVAAIILEHILTRWLEEILDSVIERYAEVLSAHQIQRYIGAFG